MLDRSAIDAASEGGGDLSTSNRVRRELARDLHDQVVQELTATLVDLEVFKRQRYDEAAVVEEVDQVQDSLRRALLELRQLLYDLRDEETWQASFMSSLEDFARRYNERRGVQVNVTADGEWPASIRAAAAKQLQRIIHEAVNNARLHGGARSVWVSLLAEAELARVTILDDGRGLDQDRDQDCGEGSGFGILGMRERAVLLGGSVAVGPGPEWGTLVRVDIPRTALA